MAPRHPPRERATYPSDGDIVAVFGAPGSGKSTLLSRAIVRDLMYNGRRAVVHDPTGSIARYSIERYGVPKEWVVRVGTASAARSHYQWGWWNRWRRNAHGARMVSIGKFGKQTSRDVAREWLDAASDSKEGWVYATDEAELVFGAAGRTEEEEDRIIDLVKLARNNRIRIYAGGQRPQLVRVLLRSNTSVACVMHSDSENIHETGMREFGGEQLFAEAAYLQQFEYLYRPKWRASPDEPLGVYHALADPIPWE